MSAERPTIRRHHDFRRVTDVTRNFGSDGDTLYRMSSDRLDRLVQSIRLAPTSGAMTSQPWAGYIPNPDDNLINGFS